MRIIDADALWMEIIHSMDYCDDLLEIIERQPTIEPERKKGKWIPQDHNKKTGCATTLMFYYPKCSECGHTGEFGMNFCPQCGADMRGEQE